MSTAAINKKRTSIELPVEIFEKIGAAVPSQGTSIKEFLESLILKEIKRAESPSPSGDPWFDDPENITVIERGREDMRQGRCAAMEPDTSTLPTD